MKKNKKIVLLSMLSGLFLVGGVCTGCADNATDGKTNADYAIASGLDFPDSITVQQGVSVAVDMPLILDGIGNVLDVTCVVKDKQGNVISLDSNRFFAVSLDGYTIEFVIKKLDGTTETKTQNVYVEGQIADRKATLVDINGISEYDVTESISSLNKEKLGSLLNAGALTWTLIDGYDASKKVELTGSTVSITNIEKRFYKVQAVKGEKAVYTGYVDFYDATEPVVWNDMRDASLANLVQCNYNSTATGSDLSGIRIYSDVDTATGDYYYTWELNGYSETKFAKDFVLQVLPQHSLAYYETLISQDERDLYSIAFSYKSELAVAQAVSPAYVNENGVIKGNVTLVNTGDWSETYSKDVDIPTVLSYNDYFLAYYNRLSATYPIDTVSPYNGWDTRTTQGVIDVYGTQTGDGSISLKGFELIKNYYTGEASLETPFASEEYNASDVFAQSEMFADLTKKGKITWIVVDETDTPIQTTGETFTAVAGKTYTVTAMHGDDEIARGTLQVRKKTYTETGVALIDVSQKSTVDVTEYVSESIIEALDGVALTWELTKNNSDKTVSAPNGIVTVANAEKCVYTLHATDTTGDVIYNGVELDFYNPADGIVWNDMTDANLAKMNGGTEGNTSTVTTVEHASIGQSYCYVKSGQNANIFFYVLPMHSVDYYQMWQTTHSNYVMNFDFALSGTGNHIYSYFGNGHTSLTWPTATAQIAINDATTPYYTMNESFLQNTFGASSNYSGYTYTLSNLINNYDYLVGAPLTDLNAHNSAFLISVNNATDRTVYIGNIRFVEGSIEA